VSTSEIFQEQLSSNLVVMLDTLKDIMLHGDTDATRLKAVDRMLMVSGFTAPKDKREATTNNVLALIQGGGGDRFDDLVSAWARNAEGDAQNEPSTILRSVSGRVLDDDDVVLSHERDLEGNP
jgi:hypothetical protein